MRQKNLFEFWCLTSWKGVFLKVSRCESIISSIVKKLHRNIFYLQTKKQKYLVYIEYFGDTTTLTVTERHFIIVLWITWKNKAKKDLHPLPHWISLTGKTHSLCKKQPMHKGQLQICQIYIIVFVLFDADLNWKM